MDLSDFRASGGGGGRRSGGVPFCLKFVLRCGFTAIYNIEPSSDAKRIRSILADWDEKHGWLQFDTTTNHVELNLRHVLCAELIDDPVQEEPPELNGAVVRFSTGHEMHVDLPEYESDDEWESTPAEMFSFELSLAFGNKMAGHGWNGDQGTFYRINMHEVALVRFARDEAYPDFDPVEWAARKKRRDALMAKPQADVQETLKELRALSRQRNKEKAATKKRRPPAKRK